MAVVEFYEKLPDPFVDNTWLQQVDDEFRPVIEDLFERGG